MAETLLRRGFLPSTSNRTARIFNESFILKARSLERKSSTSALKSSREHPSVALCKAQEVYKNLLKNVNPVKDEYGEKSHINISWFPELTSGRREVLMLLFLFLGLSFPGEEKKATASEAEDDAEAEEYLRASERPVIPEDTFGGSNVVSEKIPEQVRVTLAGSNRMAVSWVTGDRSVPSVVLYGTIPTELTNEASGTSQHYEYMGWRSGQIHRVILGQENLLEDDKTYFYKVGNGSEVFSFKTPPGVGPETPLSLHVLGDLGQTGWSVSTLAHMSEKEHDLVLYAGDLSYADRFQPRWDTWGRLVSPLASSRPWMTVHGNHEKETVPGLEPPFKAYNARYTMPYRESGSDSNSYYSFKAGSAHFLMLGSYQDFSRGSPQYTWLSEELSRVDRTVTPWLIAVLHAPWYNSNECHLAEGEAMMAALEPMLHSARVDFLFAGHVHAYERSARVYNRLPHEEGTIHITIGDGGNREGLASTYIEPCPEWSLRREASFGHGELTLVDSSTARWEWHRNQDDESVPSDVVSVECLAKSALRA